MNKIRLGNLQLKTFTEQDAEDYCLLNNINPDNIIKLYLNFNKLTDISGIKLFKNTKELWLYENKLTDISVIQYLTNLEYLDISNNQIKNISVIKDLNNLKWLSINYLELESDQIKYINKCKNLETLICINGFKNRSILNQLNKDIIKIK